jgi:hypothetical protein
VQFLVRDRAGQVTGAFGAVLAGAGIEVVTIPPRPASGCLCGQAGARRLG